MTAEPVQLAAVQPDLGPILPVTGRATIEGRPVRVKRLRARETLALARILAAGLGDALLEADVDWSDAEDIKGNLVGMLVVALPAATEETFAFFSAIVEPVAEADRGAVEVAMRNPDVGDLLDLVETVIDQEGESVADLLGKAEAVDEGGDAVRGQEASGWSRRPFARTLDLISSEYGWSDDRILDLTLERLRQVRDVILERLAEQQRQAADLVERQTVAIMQAVHAAAGNSKGVEWASGWRLYEEPEVREERGARR